MSVGGKGERPLTVIGLLILGDDAEDVVHLVGALVALQSARIRMGRVDEHHVRQIHTCAPVAAQKVKNNFPFFTLHLSSTYSHTHTHTQKLFACADQVDVQWKGRLNIADRMSI